MICGWPTCGTVFCDDSDSFPPGGVNRKRYCSRWCMRRHYVERRTGASLAADAPLCRLWNKDPYPGEAQAEAAVPTKSAAYGRDLFPYQCDDCGEWHLTSHPRGRTMTALVLELARKLNTRP